MPAAVVRVPAAFAGSGRPPGQCSAVKWRSMVSAYTELERRHTHGKIVLTT
ncbi:hypothetical protein [Nocardia tengchongensis]|uniref:hypothetical protein n=1 Tax=Nocardia tengchongensis TaxID=2055889 RepID=UPI0036A367A9